MTKSDLLAKLEMYKDKPIIIGLQDEGQCMFGNISGHWLFIDGDNVVEVRINTGITGVSKIGQNEVPFIVTYAPVDTVGYVQAFIGDKAGSIAETIGSLTPVGTSKSITDIQSEIESNPVRKALTPRGNLNVDDVAPGKSYGQFKGSAISTSISGLPKYYNNLLEGQE